MIRESENTAKLRKEGKKVGEWGKLRRQQMKERRALTQRLIQQEPPRGFHDSPRDPGPLLSAMSGMSINSAYPPHSHFGLFPIQETQTMPKPLRSLSFERNEPESTPVKWVESTEEGV